MMRASHGHITSSTAGDMAVVPLVTAGVAGVGLGGGYLVSAGPTRMIAGAMALAVAAAVASALSVRALATGLLLLAGATAGMNSLRLGGSVTATDAFLLGAAVLLLPALPMRRRVEGINAWYLSGGTLLLVGSLLGATANSDYSSNLGPVVKLVIAVALVYAVLVAWAPTIKECWLLIGSYVASAAVSSLWGTLHTNPYTGRAVGLMVHSNHLALVAVLALGPAIVASLAFRRWVGVAASVASALLIAGIVASGSRAGLVGMGVIVLLAATLVTSRRGARATLALVLGVAVVVSLFLVTSPTQNALARTFGSSTQSARQSDIGRRELIADSVKLIDEHPLTGAGLAAAKQPHDLFLGLQAGGGPLALFGGVLLALLPIRALARARRLRTVAHHSISLVTGLGIGGAGFFTASLFQNTVWDRYIWLPLALLAVVAARLESSVGRAGA